MQYDGNSSHYCRRVCPCCTQYERVIARKVVSAQCEVGPLSCGRNRSWSRKTTLRYRCAPGAAGKIHAAAVPISRPHGSRVRRRLSGKHLLRIIRNAELKIWCCDQVPLPDTTSIACCAKPFDTAGVEKLERGHCHVGEESRLCGSRADFAPVRSRCAAGEYARIGSNIDGSVFWRSARIDRQGIGRAVRQSSAEVAP